MALPRNGRNVVSRKMPIWVGHYEPLELFCLWTKVHQFSLPNVEGVVVDEVFFQMFDMSISSGDIRDQSRKLSEIAPKFGRFLALPNFWGGLSKSCMRVITPTSRHVVLKSFVRILPLAQKLLRLIC